MGTRMRHTGFARNLFSHKISRTAVVMTIYGALLGLILFRHFLGVIVCSGVFLVLNIRERETARDNRMLMKQTADLLEAMAGMIAAGRGFTGALISACQEVEQMYLNMGISKTPILDVVRANCGHRDKGCSRTFAEIGSRTNSAEIRAFAGAVEIIENKGGNGVVLCSDTCDALRRKCELHEDIELMRTDLDLSRKILFVSVPLIVILLTGIAPDFLDCLYTGTGRLVSVVAYVSVVVAWVLARRICRIDG